MPQHTYPWRCIFLAISLGLLCLKAHAQPKLEPVKLPVGIERTIEQVRGDILKGRKWVIVDVRSRSEHDEARIKGTRFLVPYLWDKQRFERIADLRKLPRGTLILVYCKVGWRSANATKIMRERGLSAYNLVGGIDPLLTDEALVHLNW